MKTASFPALLAAFLCSAGCAQSLLNSSMLEQRVVQQFADAVAEENEPALRRIASSRFEEKAMKSEDVLTDLRVVHLPTGELSVVEVKDVAEDRREVIVKEDAGGKYQFQLFRDPVKGYWVVDDVVVRQRNNGTRIAKSTTEVMDLLATLRTFLDVWETGTRDEILAMTSPELSESLEPLPDKWLKALTARLASSYEEGMARKPEANLNQDDAIVKLPARNGHLMMRIVRGPEGWLVDDVEAHNHREENHPGSVRRQADAINAVNAFLSAYLAADRETLEQLTSENLYRGSLKLADLSLIKLPAPADVPAEFDLRAYESQLTFMIPAGKEIVRLDLRERSEEDLVAASSESKTPGMSPPRFLVEEVTLYERSTQKQRTLSAVFTAPTRASMFLKALSARDHELLSHISSGEFARATWERVSPEILQILPIPDLFADGIEVSDSSTIADLTELEFVNSRGQVFSCRLITNNGVIKLDDVQYPNDRGQITSLRTQLELAAPILEFATAWQQNDLTALQKACSTDFNRLVWSHLEGIPQQFPHLAANLKAPITDTRITQDRATIRLRPENSEASAVATLVTEHGYWVVEEIQLEKSPGQMVQIRRKLREQIAARLFSGSYSMVHAENGHDRVIPVQRLNAPSSAVSVIEQASAEFAAEHADVNHADLRRIHSEDSDGGPRSTPVIPAVQTRVLPDNQFAEMPFRGNTNSITQEQDATQSTPPQPAASEFAVTGTGVQVFGPQAQEVVRSLETPARPDGISLDTPIDMTPVSATSRPVAAGKSDSAQASGDRLEPQARRPAGVNNPEPGFLYFGPPSNEEDHDTVTDNSRSTTPTARQMREPADKPISID